MMAGLATLTWPSGKQPNATCIGTLSVNWIEVQPWQRSDMFAGVTAIKVSHAGHTLACRTSGAAFVRAGSISLQDAAQQACGTANGPAYNTTALTYDCALFARKFPRDTASAAQFLLASCGSGLNITNDGVCDERTEQIPEQRVSSAHSARHMLREEQDWLKHVSTGRQHVISQRTLHQSIPDWLEDRL